MRLNIDRLPRNARLLANVLGSLEAMLALVQHAGGRVIWPHKTGPEYAALAEAIGEEPAQRFVRHFREPVSVPKCDDAIRAAVRESIRAEFDRMTRAGASARAAVAALAGQPPLHYTERHVWRILGCVDEGKVVSSDQGELF